jgi:hypothetical protein
LNYANIINNVKVLKLRFPESYIGRIQVAEYFRAFLLGRPDWAAKDGRLLSLKNLGYLTEKQFLR